MKFIYLACPYANPDEVVRNDRSEASDYYAAQIVLKHHAAVFAPISQGPGIARHLPPEVAATHAFWMAQDIRILRTCTDLWLLPMQGWEFSKGVAQELKIARQLGIPVTLIRSPENTLVDHVALSIFELNYGIKADIVCL